MKLDIADAAKLLQDVFGQKLVAVITGVQDPKQVGRWISGKNRPRIEAERRLRFAVQVFQMLQAEDSVHTIRAWFIGMNPQLNDDESPAEAIAADRFRDVMAAAEAYLAGG